MNFDDVQPTDNMRTVSFHVADELREHIIDLYARQHRRNIETDGNMANAVLAGLTVLWLEAVHASWNTMLGESAISILRDLCPDHDSTTVEVKQAARDFLRRSNWWLQQPI